MSYLTQPIIYPELPASAPRARLSTLIARAKAATSHDDSLRIGIVGDSTTTSFGGAGVWFHHALYSRLGAMFGNVAGSQIVGLASNQNGAPWVDVGALNIQASPFATSHEWASGGVNLFGGLPFAGETAYQPVVRFASLGFRPSIADTGEFVLGTTLFPTDNIRLEIVGIKRTGSASGVKVIWAPTNDRTVNLFDSQLASETIDMDLDADNGGVVEMTSRFRTTARTPASGLEPQWYLQSSEATTVGAGSALPPLIAGVRVLNANPVGAMIDCISSGGYNAFSWFGDTLSGASSLRANAAPAMAQLRHDIVFFAMGANDIYVAGHTTGTIRRNYYDSDGTNNHGLIGELIDEYEARGITVPLIVLIANPFRANDGDPSWSSAKAAQHAALADELVSLANELQADGYDCIVLNAFRYTASRGFNATIDDLVGLTDRGTYDTGSVAYAAQDRYLGSDGKNYRCVLAHTSSAATEPTDLNIGQHAPLRVHLTDIVHWTRRGSELMADAYEYLFAAHETGASELNQTTIDSLANAVLAKFPSNTQTLMYLVPSESRILTHDFGGTVTGTPTAQLYIAGSTSGSAVNGILDSGSRWTFTVPIPSGATKGASSWIRLSATVNGVSRSVDLQSMIANTGPVDALGTQGLAAVVTLLDDDSLPVSNSVVNILNSSGVALNIYGRTDALGKVTLRVPAGSYQFAVSARSGFEIHTPQNVTLSADGQAVALSVTRVSDADPLDTPNCAVTVNVLNQHGRGINRAKVWAKLKKSDAFINSALVQTQDTYDVTDSSGRAVLTLLRGASFINGDGAYQITVETPAGITVVDNYIVPDVGSTTLEIEED